MHNAFFYIEDTEDFIFFSLKDLCEKMRGGNNLFNRAGVSAVGRHHVGCFLGIYRRLWR
jgi:hypothetical protein